MVKWMKWCVTARVLLTFFSLSFVSVVYWKDENNTFSIWNPLNKYSQVQWYCNVTHWQSTERIDCVYRQLVTVFFSFSPLLCMFKAFSVRSSHMHTHCFDWWVTINKRPDKVDNDDVIATGHWAYWIQSVHCSPIAISICYNRIGVYQISMAIYLSELVIVI